MLRGTVLLATLTNAARTRKNWMYFDKKQLLAPITRRYSKPSQPTH